MERRGRWAIAGFASVALVVLGYFLLGSGEEGIDSLSRTEQVDAIEPVTVEADSPFASVPDDGRSAEAETGAAPVDGVPASETEASNVRTAREEVPVDVQAVGRETVPDAEFEALVARLSRDPALLAALIDEFRSESDPERRARLVRLLGDVRVPEVSMLAAELIYSGDATSRALGLELLGRVQPGNGEARDVISGLLSTESESEVLVGTLTAMAVPGAVGPGERATLAEQVSLLTRHSDPAVRRTSLDILSRWSDSPEHTPLLLDGLADTDPIVRRTAAYALVGHEDASESVMNDLFEVVANADEVERTRRGAILALKGMPLDDERRRRLDEIERGLNLR